MERKKNIGIFIDAFYPMIDGVVSVVDNYARLLSKYANVTVFTIKGRSDYDDSRFPYKVVRCKSIDVFKLDYNLGVPIFDLKFKKAVRKSHLDIVHIHSPFSIGKTGLKYARTHKIPVVASLHSQFKRDFERATKNKTIVKWLVRRVTRVYDKCNEAWAVNSEVAKVFDGYGLKAKTIVMNNATEMQPLETVDESILAKYGINPNERNFLFVGRINVVKNIYFIVDVMERLKATYGSSFKMYFVGSGQDEVKLKKYIADKDMEDCVKMLGAINDRNELANIYKACHLFVFPSLYDCSSIVQIESASQRTPAIFMQGAVTAENVADGINGYLGENDVEKFAEKIASIFADEEQYNKVCDNCFKTLYVNWDTKIQEVYGKYLEKIDENNAKLYAKKHKKEVVDEEYGKA